MSLDTLKRSNSLDKLLNAVKEDNAPQEKNHTLMKDYGNQNWISLVMVTQSFVSYHHQRVRTSLARKFGIMRPGFNWSNGILKTHLQTIGQKILNGVQPVMNL